MNNLQKEYNYYLEHRAELLEVYSGKVIAIKDCEVLGAFNSEIEAYQKTLQAHEKGTVLIQECNPVEGSSTQTYHSRVFIS